ncbi:hypothetical protein NE865_04355 [Phthorimaea operculella]|nr:hypothetical protein NE865_04355 [Phthorimaea operculella]
MMDHILQHDWCDSGPDASFLNRNEINNCAVFRLINNTYHEPSFNSSESEDEQPRPQRPRHKNEQINWNQIFDRPDNPPAERDKRVFVAGLHAVPPYPKLSALTKQQHFICLKVLCTQNPNVLASQHIPKARNYDYRIFQEVKETYLNEQKEYLEWARTLWTMSHSSRALRPKPITEKVYEAEFKMRESTMQSFPRNFEMAAHISLADAKYQCQMSFKQDLVKVNLADLPKAEIPQPFVKKLSICRYAPGVPEPCEKHPCWFILPNERSMTVLPLTEIHRELGQFAVDNGAYCVTSESALKCLVEVDRDWTIPISVVEAISLDGETKNVLILGSEFSTNRKSAMERTYKAFRHLLRYALIPLAEKDKMLNQVVDADDAGESGAPTAERLDKDFSEIDVTSDEDDDEGQLVINESIISEDDDDDDEPAMVIDEGISESEQPSQTQDKSDKEKEEIKQVETKTFTKISNKQVDIKTTAKISSSEEISDGKKKNNADFYSCSCKDMYRKPPPRSFRKWEVKNNKNGDKIDLIVHCSHKLEGPTGEIIAEPHVEYQIDLGGSKQSSDKWKSLALSLLLRENASLVNARVDNSTGDVVTLDTFKLNDLIKQDASILPDVSNTIFATLNQLQSLLPGHYILQHEVNHGANALLYATKLKGDGQKLSLNFDSCVLAEADEAKGVKQPPVLTPVLLPQHKYRQILPLAFTPFPYMVAREPKKQPVKTKPPPQALRDGATGPGKWPKRKKKKGKKHN